MDINEQIKKDISENKIVVFMKGDKGAPECGFSAAVCDALNQLNVAFETRNVLTDPALREGIKIFSNWPTIPQLYVNGEFIGGCDIVLELFKNGELNTIVAQAQSA